MRAVGAGKADAAVYDRLSQSPFSNAQLRTTCVATMVQAGHAENALPQSAAATVNCRILPHEDAKAVEAELRRLAAQGRDQRLNAPTLSPPSPLRADVMAIVEDSPAKCGPASRWCPP
jgi:acetylornithine deacetylase/succinyl-diaminopimelate desuccinylase-like protein